jgi:DUF4097 and DUF4098 domain-containing protein YvlB
MKRIYFAGFILALGLAVVLPASAQDTPVTVAFSDPSRPGTLKMHLLQGSISIKGTSGKDVVITAKSRGSSNRKERTTSNTDGLHRLDAASTGLSVEEQNNVMTISAGLNSVDLQIDVPIRTNLQVGVVNGGGMTIEGVDGQIDAENQNGSITLTDVSGSVLAHSLNGKVVATMKRVTPQQPMAFSSMNGNVDVTLPPDTKADLKLKTDNGDVWTDFDVQMKAGSQPTVSDTRRTGGRYKIQVDRTFVGSINGGGPNIEMYTMNGSVFIRKAKP